MGGRKKGELRKEDIVKLAGVEDHVTLEGVFCRADLIKQVQVKGARVKAEDVQLLFRCAGFATWLQGTGTWARLGSIRKAKRSRLFFRPRVRVSLCLSVPSISRKVVII